MNSWRLIMYTINIENTEYNYDYNIDESGEETITLLIDDNTLIGLPLGYLELMTETTRKAQ